MTSPCRGCKMSGKTAPRVENLKAEMNAKYPKSSDEMSDAEVLICVSEWMAKKNGGTMEQATSSLSALPPAHLRIQLDALRK